MNIYSKNLFAAVLLTAFGSPLYADGFSVVTDKPTGEVLSLAVNAGVRATVMWDDDETTRQEVRFTGDFLEIPVAGKTLQVNSEQTITQLYCSGNMLSQLNVAGLKNLETLVCNDNNLSMLSLYTNTQLQELSCQRNQLKSLSLQTNKELERLNVAQNPLTTLTLTSAPQLAYINVAQTQMNRFNATNYSDLKVCIAQEGTLSAITLPASVEEVYVSKNELQELDLKQNTGLKQLWLSDNQLTNLDLNAQEALEGLVAENNQLKSVGISRATRLTLENFFVAGNALTYNSFPTPSGSLTVSVSPQQTYNLNVSVPVGETLKLDSLLYRNAWGAQVTPEVVWKYKENGNPLPEGSYENARGGVGFIFNEPVGAVCCDVTSSLYPDFVMQIDGIQVGSSTGVQDATLDADCTISAGKQQLTVACARPTSVTVLRADGSLVLTEQVSSGTHTWNLPSGVYLVNKKKVFVR